MKKAFMKLEISASIPVTPENLALIAKFQDLCVEHEVADFTYASAANDLTKFYYFSTLRAKFNTAITHHEMPDDLSRVYADFTEANKASEEYDANVAASKNNEKSLKAG